MVLCCAVCRIVEVNRQQPVGGSRKPAGESQQVEDGCQQATASRRERTDKLTRESRKPAGDRHQHHPLRPRPPAAAAPAAAPAAAATAAAATPRPPSDHKQQPTADCRVPSADCRLSMSSLAPARAPLAQNAPSRAAMSKRGWGGAHWQRESPGRWRAVEARPGRQAGSPPRDVVDHRRPVQAATTVQRANGWELVIANRHQAFG